MKAKKLLIYILPVIVNILTVSDSPATYAAYATGQTCYLFQI